VLDLSAEGPGFKSQPRRCRVTVLGKLFTSIESSPSSEIGSSSLKVCGGNCGLGGKLWQPTAGCMTHATCRLTAKKPVSAPEPYAGQSSTATFTFFYSTRTTQLICAPRWLERSGPGQAYHLAFPTLLRRRCSHNAG